MTGSSTRVGRNALSARLVAAAVFAAVLLGTVVPAAAHRLKLFLTTDAGDLTGYAFFVGGGRPEGVELVVTDAKDRKSVV
jgi:hypothetical protein